MSAVLEPGREGLRLMTAEDLDRIMEIETAAYPFPWTRGIFRDCLHVGYSCWVYESGSRVVGYAIMAMGAGEAHLLNLCVDPAHRRRGIGRIMLGHMMDLARAHNAETLLLEVRPSNTAAINLYREEGFCEVGMRRDYYPGAEGAREDALIMARALS